MDEVVLSINLVPSTAPPHFRWQQTIDTLIGKVTVEHEGQVPVELEGALELLITEARGYVMECASLRGIIDSLKDKVAKQEEMLGAARELSRVESSIVKPANKAKN